MPRLVLGLALVVCGCSDEPEPLPASIAATVDGEAITTAELQAQLQLTAGDLGKLPAARAAELSKQQLDRLIEDRLCTKALAALKAPITDAELDAELARRDLASGSATVVRAELRKLMCRKRLVERRGRGLATSGDANDRQAAVERGRQWRDEEQRIFRELRQRAAIRVR